MPSYHRADYVGVNARARFNNITEVMAPEYRDWDAEDIRILFEQMDIDADLFESLWGRVKSFGKRVSKVMSKTLPVVAKLAPAAGTMIGGAFGGPIGASQGGNIGSYWGRVLSGSVRPRQAALNALMGNYGQHQFSSSMGQGQFGSPNSLLKTLPQSDEAQTSPDVNTSHSAQQIAAFQGSPAARELLQLLFRPEVLNALLAASMGPLGASSIRVGSQKYPPSAIINLISLLAREATLEYNSIERIFQPHLEHYDSAGEKIDDPSESALRAARLLGELQEVYL
jgi:hypothetical protein